MLRLQRCCGSDEAAPRTATEDIDPSSSDSGHRTGRQSARQRIERNAQRASSRPLVAGVKWPRSLRNRVAVLRSTLVYIFGVSRCGWAAKKLENGWNQNYAGLLRGVRARYRTASARAPGKPRSAFAEGTRGTRSAHDGTSTCSRQARSARSRLARRCRRRTKCEECDCRATVSVARESRLYPYRAAVWLCVHRRFKTRERTTPHVGSHVCIDFW